MKHERLRLGLIGCGRIGRIHAENVARRTPGAVLTVVCDADRRAAEAVAAPLGIPAVTERPEEVFSDPAVEAVIIASPTDTHADYIVEAARAAKHIFCEKPIDYDLPRTDAALHAVRQAGVKLQVGFNRRFDANFARLRRAVTSGEIGTLREIHIVSRDPAPPPVSYLRRSGGLFLDMTIHDFDMARFLVGEEVAEVYAQAGVLVDAAIGEAGDIDTAVTVLRFENGVLGTIANSRQAAYGYDQRVELLGSRGSAAAGNRFPNEVVLSDAHSVRRDLPLHFFLERYQDSFAAEIACFVQAVLGDRPPEVTGADGRAAAVLALAAAKSCREHRPVRVAEIG
ncbi:MAG: inositol 2-dehydrogenase [Bryobacteraceae bacterium]|jgi:myo-inositol 2-dehydrogenase/D-chiro-inositol 1-dehydrogenase|nr:inositol 2-dehydrogenase [Bryobacteraceae bacterium]